jgi:multidrug efflux pump
MKSFNLSTWAVTHRALVLFLIIGTLLVGAFSFTRSGGWRTRTSTCRR